MSCASLALPAPLLMLCCPQHRLSACQTRCIIFWIHIMIPPKCSSLWEAETLHPLPGSHHEISKALFLMGPGLACWLGSVGHCPV